VLPEEPPHHLTICRTRRLIDIETDEAVFTSMLQRLAEAGQSKTSSESMPREFDLRGRHPR
jgi:hypothetical protein